MADIRDYVLPGFRDPIGEWPAERLMSALEDLLYDRENGFLPPEVAEAVEYLSQELFGREEGEERRAAERKSALGRMLDAWFPASRAELAELDVDPDANPLDSLGKTAEVRAAAVLAELQAAQPVFAAMEPANENTPALANGPSLGWDHEP